MSPIVLDQPVPNTSGIHPALRNFADECSAVAVRIMAYVCGLAVLTVIAVDLVSAMLDAPRREVYAMALKKKADDQ